MRTELPLAPASPTPTADRPCVRKRGESCYAAPCDACAEAELVYDAIARALEFCRPPVVRPSVRVATVEGGSLVNASRTADLWSLSVVVKRFGEPVTDQDELATVCDYVEAEIARVYPGMTIHHVQARGNVVTAAWGTKAEGLL